jgi:hypothetical protein
LIFSPYSNITYIDVIFALPASHAATVIVVFNFRKFCGIILQFQLLEKILGIDMHSSEIDMADTLTSNEDLK